MGGSYILKVNNLCNLNCCFCADSIQKRSEPDFNYDVLRQKLEENRRKFDNLIITGGEPTIYRHLIELIRHAKNIGYQKIFLTTNALLLHSQENANRLIAAGIDTFLISFPCSDERMHDAIVKKKGSFRLSVQAIKNIKQRGKEIRINMALHKLNYKHAADTVAFLISLGVDAIQLAFLNPVGSSMVNGRSAVALSYAEVTPHMGQALETADRLGFKSLYLENVPLCIMPQYPSRLSDLRKPDENKQYYNLAKTKSQKCQQCAFFDICDGVWKQYLVQFGDAEIRPISDVSSILIRKKVLEVQ